MRVRFANYDELLLIFSAQSPCLFSRGLFICHMVKNGLLRYTGNGDRTDG